MQRTKNENGRWIFGFFSFYFFFFVNLILVLAEAFEEEKNDMQVAYSTHVGHQRAFLLKEKTKWATQFNKKSHRQQKWV